MTTPKEYDAVQTDIAGQIEPSAESQSQDEPIPETNGDSIPKKQPEYDRVHTTDNVQLVPIDDDNTNELQLNVVSLTDNNTNGDNNSPNRTENVDTDDDDWPQFNPLSCCYPFHVYKKDWRQVKNECLAGIIVAFAQIPESVAVTQ